MGTFSIWHWIIVLIIVLLLFGKGKIPSLMADMAKGIKSFKSNMAEDEKPANPDQDNKDNQNKVAEYGRVCFEENINPFQIIE